MSELFQTPRGRLVGGSVGTPQTKDFYDKECEPKTVVYLAIPKTDPGVEPLIQKIKDVALAGYTAVGRSEVVEQPGFSWKYYDGDSTVPNTKGVAPAQRDGWPGHYVFVFETRFHFNTGNAQNQQIDPKSVGKGDWIQIAGDVGCKGQVMNPSVFLNLRAVRFLEKGDPIQGGMVSLEQAFGGEPSTPSAPTPPPVATAPATPAAPTPPVAPEVPAVPAPDIVNNVAGVPAPPPPAPAAPQFTLTAKGIAEGCNPTAWIAGGTGWTEDVLRQQGYIQ